MSDPSIVVEDLEGVNAHIFSFSREGMMEAIDLYEDQFAEKLGSLFICPNGKGTLPMIQIKRIFGDESALIYPLVKSRA